MMTDSVFHSHALNVIMVIMNRFKQRASLLAAKRPSWGYVPSDGEQGERAVFAGYYCVTCTVPTIPSPYLTPLVSHMNNPNRIFEMNCK